MFDDQEKRLTAFRIPAPNIVLLALYGIALVAIGFAAYASGPERRRWRLPIYVMILLVAAVILLVQDIDRPGAGFVAVGQQPMVDIASALQVTRPNLKIMQHNGCDEDSLEARPGI